MKQLYLEIAFKATKGNWVESKDFKSNISGQLYQNITAKKVFKRLPILVNAILLPGVKNYTIL